MLIQNTRTVKVLDPAANRFAGTVYTKGVNIARAGRVTWIVQKGVGTTGTTQIQVVAGDDNSPTNEVAVEFVYRRSTSADARADVIQAAAAGFLTTAGTGDYYEIEINAKGLAASGYKYAFLKMVEGTASAVLGSVIAILSDLRYADDESDVTS